MPLTAKLKLWKFLITEISDILYYDRTQSRKLIHLGSRCTDMKFSYVKSTSLNLEFRNVSFYDKVFLFCMYLILSQ